MNWPIGRRHRKQARSLGRYWDDVIRRTPTLPVVSTHVEQELTVPIRQLHAQDEATHQGNPLRDDLLRTILNRRAEIESMSTQTAVLAAPVSDTRWLSPGLASRDREQTPSRARTRHRPLLQGAALLTIVAVIAIVIGQFYGGGNDNYIFAPGDATPFATPSPAVSPVGAEIYRGTAARTGEMPGPGPATAPPELWSFVSKLSSGMPPIAFGGIVYMGTPDGKLLAINEASGQQIWSFDTGTPGLIVASAANGQLFITNQIGEIIAIDAATGVEHWRQSGARLNTSPIPFEDKVLIDGPGGASHVRDQATGDDVAVFSFPRELTRSPAYADGIAYGGTEAGDIVAVDIATNTVEWRHSVDQLEISTPVVANGVVYDSVWDSSNAGTLIALKAETGEQLWTYSSPTGQAFAAPSVSDGVIVACGFDGTIYGLNATDGTLLWSSVSGDPVGFMSAPGIANGTAYIGTSTGKLIALDLLTGANIWATDTGTVFAFGPAVLDGVLVLVSKSGDVHVYGKADLIPAVAAASGATPSSLVPTEQSEPTATATSPSAAGPQARFLWASSGSAETQLFHPLVARVSPDGQLWVGDQPGRFLIFDLDGNLLEVWGSHGSGPGQFNFNRGEEEVASLAFAPDGSFYVSDSFNFRIQHFDRDRTYLGEWGSQGTADGQFILPYLLSIAPNGDVYVTDDERRDVQRFDANGAFLGKFDARNSTDGPLIGPCGIAIDNAGRMYISELEGNRVREFDSAGNQLAVLGAADPDFGGFNNPCEVSIDDGGRVYVADQFNSTVDVFDPDGHYIFQWGEAGTGDGQFDLTGGVTTNRGGTAYVLDWHASRVEKFQVTGLPAIPEATPTQ